MSDHWGTPTQPDPAEQPLGPEILSSGPGQGSFAAVTSDILATQPAAKAGGKGKWIAAGAGVVVVAGIGAGAAFAAGAFGGGGAEPATLVPSTAVAYVSVDLDPSLGQKVDALRFLRKFPAIDRSIGSTDDLREYFFDEAIKGDPSMAGVTYAADVKPWVGDRFGVAVVPDGKAGASPNVVVVVQVTDAAKARAGLKKLLREPGAGTCAVSDGFAVCAQDASHLAAAQGAAKQHSLAQDSTFAADVATAGKPGFALAWGDLSKVTSLLPPGALSGSGLPGLSGLSGLSGMAGLAGQQGQALAGSSAPAGRVVAAVRFSGANLQVSGRLIAGKPDPAVAPGGTAIEQLPANTEIALGGSTTPATIAAGYRRLTQQLTASGGSQAAQQLQGMVSAFGFHLPGDLDSLLGTKFAVAFNGEVAGEPDIGVKSNANAQKAAPVVDAVSQALQQAGAPFELHHAAGTSGYAFALSQSYANQLAGTGSLGATATFRAAVPDAASANLVLFVNVPETLASDSFKEFRAEGNAVDQNLANLSAVGFTAASKPDGTSTFALNVLTK